LKPPRPRLLVFVVAYYAEALALWPPDAQGRAELLFRRAHALHVMGDNGQAAALEEARDALLAIEDEETAGEVSTLRHANGRPLTQIYGPTTPEKRPYLATVGKAYHFTVHKLEGDQRVFVDAASESVVGANQLANVRWSAVFGDVELTAADIARLAKEARPLIRSGGKWVALDKADLRAAADALAAKADTTQLTGADMLRLALGLEV
jgi:hypothetical protein